jgi:putative toxin-antitoxin system antitoxin component (TIGR02293 family)
MAGIHHLVQVLGGRQFLGSLRLDITRLDEQALIAGIRSGLPFEALEAVASRFGLGATELVRILRLPQRTLARRKQARMLTADESDRLMRVARIAALAEETLGSAARAGRWLHEPNAALGSVPPIRWLDTDLGAKEVEELLIRVGHGVYS